MEDNLKIYNMIKKVPDEAQKKITGGRLSGMTDIKPMWRIEKLTEIFGPCGLGWYTTTRNREIIEHPFRSDGGIKNYILMAEVRSFDAPEGDSICLNIDTHLESL